MVVREFYALLINVSAPADSQHSQRRVVPRGEEWGWSLYVHSSALRHRTPRPSPLSSKHRPVTEGVLVTTSLTGIPSTLDGIHGTTPVSPS